MAMFHERKPQFRIRNTNVSEYLSKWVSRSMQATMAGQQTFILSVLEADWESKDPSAGRCDLC